MKPGTEEKIFVAGHIFPRNTETVVPGSAPIHDTYLLCTAQLKGVHT